MATDVIVRPAGARAVLLELDNLEQVAAWREAVAGLVAGSLLASPADVVPGARTLLLDGVDPAAVRRALAGLGTPAAVVDRPDAPPVEVPVVYDGADLAEVAQLWGVSEREVVARHTGTQFRVAFCGFAPGFPYLVGLDRQVPRRPTPRPSVPAGSVGLAGRYCGIYPTSSPGGWQLLGTTAVPLFDVSRDPPALLPPGSRVHFVETSGPSRPPAPARETAVSRTPAGPGSRTSAFPGPAPSTPRPPGSATDWSATPRRRRCSRPPSTVYGCARRRP